MEQKETLLYFSTISSIVIAFIGTGLNILIVITYNRRTSLRSSVPHLLIVHQSVVDSFKSLIVCTWDAVGNIFSHILPLQAFYFNRALSISSSIFFFLLVGVDRLIAVTQPLFYRTRITWGSTKKRVAIVWTAALIFSFISMLVMVNVLPQICHLILQGLAALSLVATTVLFIATYIMACRALYRRRRVGIRAVTISETAEEVQQEIFNRKQIKMTKVFSIMFCGFLLAFGMMPVCMSACKIVPYHLTKVHVNTSHNLQIVEESHLAPAPTVLFTVTHFLLKMSSVINPITVFLLDKDFRPNLC